MPDRKGTGFFDIVIQPNWRGISGCSGGGAACPEKDDHKIKTLWMVLFASLMGIVVHEISFYVKISIYK